MKKPLPPQNRKVERPKSRPVSIAGKKGKSAQALSTNTTPKKSDNPKIVELLKARATYERHKKAHRKALLRMIAQACNLGKSLQDDDEAWAEFCKLDWRKLKGPTLTHQADALRFALKFIFAKGKKGESRASFYYNAVKGLVEKGLQGEPLIKAIKKAGGLKKLQQQKGGDRKPKEMPERLLETSVISDVVDDDSPEDNDDHLFVRDEPEKPRSAISWRPLFDDDEDDGEKLPTPKQSKGPTEVPFVLKFSEEAPELFKMKFPAQVIIKGTIERLGSPFVLGVEKFKQKKPKG